MLVEVLEERYSNTYFVGDETSFVVIDPSVDIKNLLYIIRKKFPSSKLVGIILTHGHYDHFATIDKLQEKYACNVYISENDYPKLTDIFSSCGGFFGLNILPTVKNVIKVKNEQILKFDSFSAKIINTPGHTNGSICILINNMLFTGDTLFNNGVGRTDLPTGNVIKLNESIKKILKMNRELVVYPGHGESTTIDYELKNNYYYQQIK